MEIGIKIHALCFSFAAVIGPRWISMTFPLELKLSVFSVWIQMEIRRNAGDSGLFSGADDKIRNSFKQKAINQLIKYHRLWYIFIGM